jgi:hypothetical protein
VRAASDWLARCAEPLAGATLAAVGHEPSITHIGRLLAGGAAFASMHKAEACFIEHGAVRWRVAPD